MFGDVPWDQDVASGPEHSLTLAVTPPRLPSMDSKRCFRKDGSRSLGGQRHANVGAADLDDRDVVRSRAGPNGMSAKPRVVTAFSTPITLGRFFHEAPLKGSQSKRRVNEHHAKADPFFAIHKDYSIHTLVLAKASTLTLERPANNGRHNIGIRAGVALAHPTGGSLGVLPGLLFTRETSDITSK